MKKQILTMTLVIFLSLSFISAFSIKDVESSPEEVTPGQIIEVSIEIENIFSDDIENLIVKLDLSDESIPFAPYQSSAEKFVEELEGGDEETLKFRLIALPSAQSGIYKIPVKTSYENKEENVSIKEEISLISLIVNSDVELKVFFEDSVLIRGKENTFSIKIINSGFADVRFAYLTVHDVVGIRFISEREQYIGDIDSDDFDSVEYNAYIGPSASSLIKLPVTLKYRDATNKEFIEQKEISFKVYSLKEAQEFGLVQKSNYAIFLGAGVLVIFYIGYRIRKKRKLKMRR